MTEKQKQNIKKKLYYLCPMTKFSPWSKIGKLNKVQSALQ